MKKRNHPKVFCLIFILTVINSTSIAQNIEGYDKMISELVQDTVPYINPEGLQKKMDTDIYILDTRELVEYETSHIPNALHVGYLFFKMKSIKDIPKGATIVTYCSVGYRSGKLGERLIRKGFQNVYNLKGGVFSWANESGTLLDSQNDTTNDVHGYDKEWSKWLNEKNCSIILK
ncbi:MAG: rhodanese-related sulfurtransferase [Patiriisocius sp.]